MKSQTIKNSITTLEALRDAHSNQLDTGVLEELNNVISDLKKVPSHIPCDVQLGTLGLRALQVISCIISLVSNLKDLMNK